MEISLNLSWVGSPLCFITLKLLSLRRHSTSVLLVFLTLILRFVFICSIKTNEQEL